MAYHSGLTPEYQKDKEGTIKFFNFEKQFGFVTGDDEVDYFIGGYQDGLPLYDGTKVMFNVMEGKRGLVAFNLRLVTK